MTDTPVITADEMADRLAALCAGGDITGLPRKQRDVAIVLASATLWMEPDAIYTEAEVNENLLDWLDRACPSLRMDVVTLRRELVDRVYLNRDDSGRQYSAGPGPRHYRFSSDVSALKPIDVIGEARRARAERKRSHANLESTEPN